MFAALSDGPGIRLAAAVAGMAIIGEPVEAPQLEQPQAPEEGGPENPNGQLLDFIAALAMSRTPAMVWSVLMWCTPLGSSHRAGALFRILARSALLCGALHEADA
ncbi:MAG TPA: hypothetical protein VK681_21270 [Reyranella sp.]|nr:hypothetical protein [Reyranella sp.]